jgi:MOSC domain-containing protein YiiM
MADFAKIARNASTRIVRLVKEPNGEFTLKGGENKMTDVEQTSDGRIVAVSLSLKKGVKKTNVLLGSLIENYGLENDAHAGDWHRQVSLLAIESIAKIQEKGLDVHPGDFAENITTEGIRLWELPVGTRMKIGEDALVEVTQIGKECHDRCAIFKQVGDCVMPREGIFVKVLKGGTVGPADGIQIFNNH